jgi:hypothetical protein
MLTAQESEYFKSLIDTYKYNGYPYYLLHTDRPGTNNYQYEFAIYFSQTPISAYSHNSFRVYNGIKINVDSSLRNVNSNNDSMYNDATFDGTVNVAIAEHIYTNAGPMYLATTDVYNPDLMYGGDVNVENTVFAQTFSFVIIISLIVALFFRLFR